MNMGKVVFGFFVLLALTLNFSFFLGEIDNPEHHSAFELFAALVVSLIATIMKLGERSQMSAMIAGMILSHIRSPLLGHFFDLLEQREDELAAEVLDRLAPTGQKQQPEFFTVRISKKRAPALHALIEQGLKPSAGLFQRDPARPDLSVAVELLMLSRGNEDHLLPDAELELLSGDRLLVACPPRLVRRMTGLVDNAASAYRALCGEDPPRGWPPVPAAQ